MASGKSELNDGIPGRVTFLDGRGELAMIEVSASDWEKGDRR